MINIASLITLATTSLEKSVGFWAAYLLPLCGLIASVVPFVLLNGRLSMYLMPQVVASINMS